jgi:hypothetical protein
VRRSRGAGTVVAVIEVLNKKNGEPFDSNDEHILAAASQSVADALAERFKELEYCAEAFSGMKISSSRSYFFISYTSNRFLFVFLFFQL